LAAQFLSRHGHKILYRNFKPERGGEIDLICRDRAAGVLVFVEVKARASESHGSPAQAVDLKKQKRLARGAAEWLSMLDDPDVPCRFDVVELVGDGSNPEIRHIRDAFRVEDPWRW
jgi:putative endonuclease